MNKLASGSLRADRRRRPRSEPRGFGNVAVDANCLSRPLRDVLIGGGGGGRLATIFPPPAAATTATVGSNQSAFRRRKLFSLFDEPETSNFFSFINSIHKFAFRALNSCCASQSKRANERTPRRVFASTTQIKALSVTRERSEP